MAGMTMQSEETPRRAADDEGKGWCRGMSGNFRHHANQKFKNNPS
jgi:hypothetical protein